MGEDRQQLIGFAAVGEQQGDVVAVDDAQIPVECIHGVEEHGCEADGGKGGGDLAGHDAALADAADHQLGAAVAARFQQGESRLHLLWIQPLGGGGDGGCFFLEAAAEGGCHRSC